MNCDDFRERLFTFVDGELGAEEASAVEHVAMCADCGGRVAFERALERRIGAALLADAPGAGAAVVSKAADGPSGPDIAELLRRARPGVADVAGGTAASGGARGRLVTLRRAVAVAAGLLLAVQAAWFFCIPPFECSLLQAVERGAAAGATPGGTPRSERLVRLEPPDELDGYARVGAAELVFVGSAGVDYAVRARYASAGEDITVLWCDPVDHRPSFRRRTERGGSEWWIASENGKNLVAWMCPVTETMCTLVSAIPEDRLVAVASEIRGTEH